MSDASAELDPETRILIAGLDRELSNVRQYGDRATRQMHKLMLQDLRRAEQRARAAEKQARRAERRADRAERELAAVRSSGTWRAGRVVVAVPTRIKRWRKS
jgi:hypothetical protein